MNEAQLWKKLMSLPFLKQLQTAANKLQPCLVRTVNICAVLDEHGNRRGLASAGSQMQ
jgi:hypothetical protein